MGLTKLRSTLAVFFLIAASLVPLHAEGDKNGGDDDGESTTCVVSVPGLLFDLRLVLHPHSG